MLNVERSRAYGRHFKLPVPPRWEQIPQDSLTDLIQSILPSATVDLIVVSSQSDATFAPNCVATYEKVAQDDLHQWAQNNLRATMDLYPGTEVIDLGELNLPDKPSNSYALLTYILNDQSVTCVQFVWHVVRGDGYVDIGILNLQCLTDNYAEHSESFLEIIEFAQMVESTDHV